MRRQSSEPGRGRRRLLDIKVALLQWISDQQKNVKMLTAVIGASAVVVMGAVAVANEQAETNTIRSAPAATATSTTPPTAPATPIATPATTASTPAGFR